MSRAVRRRQLKEFLDALKHRSSTCRVNLRDLERLLDACLLCHGAADRLGVWLPDPPLWGELDARRVTIGQAPRADGKTPACVYALCPRCAEIPQVLTIVEGVLLGRQSVLMNGTPFAAYADPMDCEPPSGPTVRR